MELAAKCDPAMKGDARHHLKTTTNKLHEQLHALPAFVSLLDNTLDLPGYISIMTRFRDFYLQLDVKMQQGCSDYFLATQRYHYRPRAPMFAADVCALVGSNRQVPRVGATLPDINGVASLAGVAYVIDGSVLGGISMNKSAAVLLGSDAIEGRTYWNWCRKHGLRQWQAALGLVEHCWQVEENRTTMTNAAVQTFNALFIALSADCEVSGAIG